MTRLTGALLNQLTHHVQILEMNGDSYRLAHSERQSRRARPEPPPEDAPPPTNAVVRNSEPQAKRPPISEAFSLGAVLHLCSGQPLQNLSGVDTAP
jgi:hypothetical protein